MQRTSDPNAALTHRVTNQPPALEDVDLFASDTALCEGVDDYRYLYTLTSLIEDAKGNRDGEVRTTAEEAEARLEDLVEGIPWANPLGGVAFEASRLQDLRREVADMIVELQKT